VVVITGIITNNCWSSPISYIPTIEGFYFPITASEPMINHISLYQNCNRRSGPVPRIIARLQADRALHNLHNVQYVRNSNSRENRPNPRLVVRSLLAQHLHNFLNTFLIGFDTALPEDLDGDLVTVVRNHLETRILKLSSLELGDIKHRAYGSH